MAGLFDVGLDGTRVDLEEIYGMVYAEEPVPEPQVPWLPRRFRHIPTPRPPFQFVPEAPAKALAEEGGGRTTVEDVKGIVYAFDPLPDPHTPTIPRRFRQSPTPTPPLPLPAVTEGLTEEDSVEMLEDELYGMV